MLYTRKAIMQSGYQYDREASAKALKMLKKASKNKKMDSILYGADIKAESVFSTLDKKTPPPPGPPSTPAPAAPPLSIPAPTSTATAPTPSATTSAAPAPPTPIPATSSISGLRGLAPGRVSVPQALTPAAVGTSSIRPRSTSLDLPGTLVSMEQIPPPTIGQTVVSTMLPLIHTAVGAAESYVKKSPTSSQAPTDTSTEIPSRAVAQAPVGPGDEPLSPSRSLGAPPLSEAGSAMEEKEEEKTPILPKYNPRHSSIQNKAKELFDLVRAEQEKVGSRITSQITITPYNFKGEPMVSRLVVKQEYNKQLNFTHYRFDLVPGGAIMKEPKGVDIVKTLAAATNAIIDRKLLVAPGTGETTGLGIGDEAGIRSPRVVFRSNKLGKTVPKGVLYVMEPQLYRGHLRLYSKSGRPVVTRSNISPSFQRLVKDVVERNTFEADDYSGLEPKETADANHFIKMTKPIQPRNINRLSNADTIYQLKKRYEVLVGELSAGNTGKVVLTEMEEILRKLIRMHAMNENKGKDLIRNLRSF